MSLYDETMALARKYQEEAKRVEHARPDDARKYLECRDRTLAVAVLCVEHYLTEN